MRLLIVGASGGCGRWLTTLAHRRGHQVTVLVRPGAQLDLPADVRVVRGSALEPRDLDEALSGCDAVASCLGLRWTGWHPWSGVAGPADLTANAASVLVPAMQRAGVRRLVVISAAGVGDSVSRLSPAWRWMVGSGNLAVAYGDMARMEDVLAASSLDWLAVRPVALLNGPPRGAARPVTRVHAWSTVRRSDVAEWMLGALEQPRPFSERTVVLGAA